MLTRALLAAAFLGMVLLAVFILRARYRRKLDAFRGQSAAGIAATLGLPVGTPAVLFLSTPRCVECHELQEPALERLASRMTVEVRKLHPDAVSAVTSRFGIVTVPATVVLDANHSVRAVNVGFIDTDVLARQLA